MHKAYSVLTIKQVDEDQRTLEGIATTPSTDSVGDVVEPLGAQFKLPLPFLLHHDYKQPVGHVMKAKAENGGISVKVRMVKAEEPGTLKSRLDEAWQSIKLGLIRGLSIGFQPIEYSRLENGGIHFIKWAWVELSAVVIPANMDANITSVKRFDTGGAKNLPTVYLPGFEGKRTLSDAQQTRYLEIIRPHLNEIARHIEESGIDPDIGADFTRHALVHRCAVMAVFKQFYNTNKRQPTKMEATALVKQATVGAMQSTYKDKNGREPTDTQVDGFAAGMEKFAWMN